MDHHFDTIDTRKYLILSNWFHLIYPFENHNNTRLTPVQIKSVPQYVILWAFNLIFTD